MTIPYFRFFPEKFMHGVRGLSAQQVGVYTMLLCRIYEENGPVEFNEKRLATYCGMRPTSFRKAVGELVDLGKLTLVEGILSNARAEKEISDRAHNLKNLSRAGQKSAEKRQQKQSQDRTHVRHAFNHKDEDKKEPNGSLARVGAREKRGSGFVVPRNAADAAMAYIERRNLDDTERGSASGAVAGDDVPRLPATGSR